MATVAKRRGRPATGPSPGAKTATQRVSALDKALIESGGRILNRLRLSPSAAQALQHLSETHGSDRAAIEAALLESNKALRATSK